MTIAVLGIALGKNSCDVAGLDCFGKVVLRKRVQRFRLLEFLSDLPACTVAMEACCGAHHIARFC
jgi:transposase